MVKIRINENQLHNIIKETIISVLNEEEIKPGSTFKISPQLGADKMIKMISDKHGINPKDLIVQRDEILYKPKTLSIPILTSPSSSSSCNFLICLTTVVKSCDKEHLCESSMSFKISKALEVYSFESYQRLSNIYISPE